jgi:hypothetical protein
MTQKISESEKKKEDWMNSKWRPMMGWTYMITCIFDFVVAPILWSLTQSLFHGSVQTQWQPLTLQGAGLYHIAMGAVLGIAAYGRTQEKLGGANNGGINLPPNAGTTYTPPTAVGPAVPGAFGAPASTAIAPVPSWGTTPIAPAGFGNDFGAPAGVITGFGGKPAPVIPPFPER